MNRIVYTLNEASLRGPDGGVVSGLSWIIRGGGVTALMGPVGSGKSLLLRVLSGSPMPSGCSRGGTWGYRGRSISETPAGLADVAWVPATRACDAAPRSGPQAAWRAAFLKGASTLLFDEAEAGLSEAERAELVQALRAHAREGGCAVIVTHDLPFARAVSDDVALLGAGTLVAHGETSDFFANPPNQHAVRFVRMRSGGPPAAR